MNYKEAMDFIHGINPLFCTPGLERVRYLCKKLGDPQNDLKFIHIAGTNGKGSTSAMLDSVLRKAGYKVGLFTSPYILNFNERVRVCGECIHDDELAELCDIVKPIAEIMQDKPTEFELITAIAMLYFKRKKCDFVILECGLGGRFDATNVIDTSILSIITGISLDHTAILGDKIEKIAWEKAGIIKEETPVIFSGESAEAGAVIQHEAHEKNAPLTLLDRKSIFVKHSGLDGTVIDFNKYKNIKLCMLGIYQAYNAATVLTAIDILRAQGILISDEAIYSGLSETHWRARFEIISEEPRVIFDGGHNAEGISAVKETVKHYFKSERLIVISGVLGDKDYISIARDISEFSDHVFTITPPNPRALTAESYAAVLSDFGARVTPIGDITTAVTEAISEAEKTGKTIIVLGSLYTYSSVINAANSYKRQ